MYRSLAIPSTSRLNRFTFILMLTLTAACGTENTSSGEASPRPSAASTAVEASATGCQRHIEIYGADFWAKELEQSETWVLANHRINLWQGHGNSRGRKVGELRVGSRAVIVEEASDAYRVTSPLDQSVGWISKAQVARTLYQDLATREPCKPDTE